MTATLGTLAAMALAACSAMAQPPASPEVQKQLDQLRGQVNTMQKDLDEIKSLLAPLLARKAAQSAPFNLGTRPVKGNPAAGVTIVELTDYQ